MTSLSQKVLLFCLAICSAGLPFCVQSSEAQWEKHWSFQALEKDHRPSASVDSYILTRLREKNLKPAKRADKATLIRRVSLDLTGLPPTREELHAFIEDESPDAYEKLVARLLASPHYGERWGRHWLDIARYVQGTIKVPGVDEIDLAESYRDYVVRAFNEDKPFDRFVLEQLAGDLLPDSGGDFDEKIAPSFLAIGPWFDECTDPNKLRLDIIDEQISTLTKAFLAMDYACARCHDHKFDPIPTRDYYAMAGIFRSTEITSKFSEFWRDGRPRAVQELASAEELAKKVAIEKEISTLLDKRFQILKDFKDSSENVWAKVTSPEIAAPKEAEEFDGQKNLKSVSVEGIGEALTTRRALDQWAMYRFPRDEAGSYQLMIRYASQESAPVKLEINGETLEKRILEVPTFGETSEHFVWRISEPFDLEKGSNHIRLKVDRHEPFPLLDKLQLIKTDLGLKPGNYLYADSPRTVAEMEFLAGGKVEKEVAAINEKVSALKESLVMHPLALAVTDTPQPVNLPVHVGGNTYQTKEEDVPRGVPGLAAGLIERDFQVPAGESGRVELAEWLTHPDNPLTARVLANRIWHWHFGQGLVRTTDDFGIQGAKPSHPELLDFLATELIENQWSIKHLHRLILLSETYRQSAVPESDSLSADDDGTLLSRFPRRRLEVEAIYDSMLTSIGKVPRQKAGEPLDTSKSKDRALYILTSSRSPVGLGIEIRKMFPLFGFDPSGRPIHQRDRSSTPNQALWWLNNPLPKYYADKLADKLLTEEEEMEGRVDFLVETVLGRLADDEMRTRIGKYVTHGTETLDLSEKEAWSRAALGLFSSEPFSHLE